jgi:transcriptional regulator with XRE-family HTH domain
MQQPELGKKILELRKQKGLTQEELVDLCNINVRTIQRIEAGEVTPRSYTIKSIFSVLGVDIEQLREPTIQNSNGLKQSAFPKFINSNKRNHIISNLNIAWVCGTIYFLLGFAEFAFDYARYYEEEIILGNAGFISLKFIVLVVYIYFIRGFYILGELYNLYLLKIAALIVISLNILFYSYDMFSLYQELFYVEYVVVIYSIFYGIGGVLLGYAMLKLNSFLGNIATITGGLKIASGVLLITVFLGILGYILLIPAVLLQIVLLYKVVTLLKAEKH